ncbi:MAG: hypothetical protein C5B50_13450 [Verrucomicrobia bacterium]|nr:MAG: hypothetical protein C5B50_13450 [Verrucomicrobiota bacterium]
MKLHTKIKLCALLAFILASVFLAGCSYAEMARQEPTTTTQGHFLGNPTPAQEAADKEILRYIIGIWTTADAPQWAHYHVLTIRSNGSFTAIHTNRTKLVCDGTWFVERGFLLLVRSNTPPSDYFGFHYIRQLDDHQLVCAPGVSEGGDMKFTK